MLNTKAAMRNWPRLMRNTVLFSYDWLQMTELDWWRSKQLVPAGCGSNRTYQA